MTFEKPPNNPPTFKDQETLTSIELEIQETEQSSDTNNWQELFKSSSIVNENTASVEIEYKILFDGNDVDEVLKRKLFKIEATDSKFDWSINKNAFTKENEGLY